jgi:hypothetical protein
MLILLTALASCGSVVSARAQAAHFAVDPSSEIGLHSGWTAVDLAFDGTAYHVLGQRNEIHTAHSNETYTFVDPHFNTVFFEPGKFLGSKLEFPSTHSQSVSTSGGADYVVTSVRLLVDTKTRSSYVVVGLRDRGNTFVDSRPVTIELLKFRKYPRQAENGDPVAAFVLVDVFVTPKCYHDANDALVNELGLSKSKFDERPLTEDRSAPCTPVH